MQNHLRFILLTSGLAVAITLAPRPSLAADPTIRECVIASNESVKLRTDHKLRQARAQLLVCVAASCPAEVREECSRRMDRLTSAIPTIVFEVKDGSGKELSAVKVTMDGEVVAQQLDGTALSLDPGSHSVTFEVAGEAPVSQTIIFHEGDKDRRVPVEIGPPPAPAAPPTTPAAPEARGHGRRLVGIVVGSVGVAGAAAGGIFGALGFSSWSAATKACPSHHNCPAAAVNDRSTALTFSTVSDVGFIAGGVLLAAGVALFLTDPKDPAVTVGLHVVPGGVRLGGTFW